MLNRALMTIRILLLGHDAAAGGESASESDPVDADEPAGSANSSIRFV